MISLRAGRKKTSGRKIRANDMLLSNRKKKSWAHNNKKDDDTDENDGTAGKAGQGSDNNLRVDTVVHHYHHFTTQAHAHNIHSHRGKKRITPLKIARAIFVMCIFLGLVLSMYGFAALNNEIRKESSTPSSKARKKVKKGFPKNAIPKGTVLEYRNGLVRAKLSTKRDIPYRAEQQRSLNDEETASSSWRLSKLQILSTPPERIAVISAAATKFWRQEQHKKSFPNYKPKRKLLGPDYPKICRPQPLRSDQPSPKLVKMNHDATKAAKNNTDYFNYATAVYSEFRKEFAFDQNLEAPSARAETTPSWQLASAPKIYNAAVCKIRPNIDVKLQHFAHAAEEIYKCFDYWAEFAIHNSLETTTARPVLLYHRETQEEYLMADSFANNTFMKGIRNFLESQIGLTILAVDEYHDCHLRHHHDVIGNHDSKFGSGDLLCDTIYHPEQTVRTYNSHGDKGYIFEHVREWNALIDRYLEANDERNAPASPAVSDVCRRPPRIGILNRKGPRSVVNSEDLARDLSGMKYVYETDAPQNLKPNNANGGNLRQLKVTRKPATVTYFENKTFVEQIRYFRDTDILISPHGAQLTGIAFMAGDDDNNNNNNNKKRKTANNKSCKQVLEFFPKNYAIPFYFGSLAVQSGMHHSYVYFDYEKEENNDDAPNNEKKKKRNESPRRVLPWERITSTSPKSRYQARQFKFCPRTDDVISYVAELVMDWYRCHGCG